MPRKKKAYNIKSRVTSALRKIWMYSPMRREALSRAKNNGNKCEKCDQWSDKLEVDHIVPVAKITGWDGDWTGYIDRLMIGPEGLQCLCTSCHYALTSIQRELRKKNKIPLTKKGK